MYSRHLRRAIEPQLSGTSTGMHLTYVVRACITFTILRSRTYCFFNPQLRACRNTLQYIVSHSVRGSVTTSCAFEDLNGTVCTCCTWCQLHRRLCGLVPRKKCLVMNIVPRMSVWQSSSRKTKSRSIYSGPKTIMDGRTDSDSASHVMHAFV